MIFFAFIIHKKVRLEGLIGLLRPKKGFLLVLMGFIGSMDFIDSLALRFVCFKNSFASNGLMGLLIVCVL